MNKEEVRLHALEKEDLEFLHRLNNTPEVMVYWFEEPYLSLTHMQNIYEEELGKDQVRQFIIKKGEDKIGFVGLFGFDGVHRKAEFGIMIDPEWQGYGYASVATKLAMDYAFLKMNVRKLYLIVDETNARAIHVYEKMGYKQEARLEKEYYVDGVYHDAIMMRMFQDEYMAFNK